MLRVFTLGLSGALAGSLLAVSSASAADARLDKFSFANLEYRTDDDQALAVARSDLASRYPIGSSAADAARGLAAGGARCKTAADAIRCDYASFEAHEDALVEVDWTVRLDTDSSGALHGLAVNRSTWGF